MIIALISDIHGNLPALMAVLQDINRAIQLQPNNGKLYLQQATLKKRAGLDQQALIDLQRAQQLGVNITQEQCNKLP